MKNSFLYRPLTLLFYEKLFINFTFYFFSVIKKLDRHAEIDYSLTEPPSFTSKYMDAYLKVTDPLSQN